MNAPLNETIETAEARGFTSIGMVGEDVGIVTVRESANQCLRGLRPGKVRTVDLWDGSNTYGPHGTIALRKDETGKVTFVATM